MGEAEVSGTMTIPQFIAHMALAHASMTTHNHHALDQASLVIENEAKDSIGHDEHPGAGPFPDWDELAHSTQEEKERLGYTGRISAYDSELRTGDLRDSYEHTVGTDEAVIGSDSEVAVYQELGTDKMPARSILGAAAARKSPEVARILGQAALLAIGGSGNIVGRLPIP
jgi:phage gpG-like protein